MAYALSKRQCMMYFCTYECCLFLALLNTTIFAFNDITLCVSNQLSLKLSWSYFYSAGVWQGGLQEGAAAVWGHWKDAVWEFPRARTYAHWVQGLGQDIPPPQVCLFWISCFLSNVWLKIRIDIDQGPKYCHIWILVPFYYQSNCIFWGVLFLRLRWVILRVFQNECEGKVMETEKDLNGGILS